MNIIVVAVVALLVGAFLGIVALCILMAGRRDEDIVELNHSLQLWRNAFSSDSPEKAMYWIKLLHEAGEVKDIDEEGNIDSQGMGRGSPDLYDA